MKCEICGAEFRMDERKCRYCGNEISVTEMKTNTAESTDNNVNEPPTKRYVHNPSGRASANNNQVEEPAVKSYPTYNDAVINKSNIKKVMFCSKCGRPLDGRTGKCIVCDYATVGQAAYMNNITKKSGGTNMAVKKKKKRHTVLTVVLSVLGIMAVFAAAVLVAFHMTGGFNHDEEKETDSPEVAVKTTERVTEIPNLDTPRATESVPTETAAPVVTSNPSMEPEEGDPAAFKGGSYIYPTHNKVITEADLELYASTEKGARLLYYEMFARYGMEFDDDDLIEYFEGRLWYTPDGGSSESKIKAKFNSVEKENERIILNYMKDHDWN